MRAGEVTSPPIARTVGRAAGQVLFRRREAPGHVLGYVRGVMDKIGVADVAQLEADLLSEALDASPQ